jgi:hypothetical protein
MFACAQHVLNFVAQGHLHTGIAERAVAKQLRMSFQLTTLLKVLHSIAYCDELTPLR